MYHRPSPHEGKWRVEMELFMDFFKKKTGIAWEDRVSLAQTMPSSYFQYEPPVCLKSIALHEDSLLMIFSPGVNP